MQKARSAPESLALPSTLAIQCNRPSLTQIMKADIVISSATFKWTHWFNEVKNDSVLFHRVVQDESHLFYSRSVSAECSKASAILAARR